MSRAAARAEQGGAPSPDEAGLARLRWVIGTPYFVQGTSNLADIPILFLYLNPDHPWWHYVTLPDWLNPLPGWNRRLLVQSVLGFASRHGLRL